MDRFDFWQKWLVVVSLIVIVFGLMLAFLYDTPVFEWMDDLTTPAFWDHSSDITPAMRDYQQWTIGVMGAVMAGWGVQMLFVARYPFKKRERWAWTSIALALVTWFLVDESISLYYGVYFNAVFNLGLLVALAVPLWFTRSDFNQ
jgi:cytochrome c biogenesis protein CcdA